MPIALSKAEWSRISGWGKREQSQLRRQEYLKTLEITSREMTKKWPNSLENVNKRNEELRRARIEAIAKANADFYQKHLQQRRDERQRLLRSARDVVFQDKDAPKTLLSAFIESAVLKEREEQIKFDKRLKEEAQRRKTEEDLEVIRRAREWEELRALKKKRRYEVNKQHQKEILDQAAEISERNRREFEEELHFQKIDNVKAKQQMEAIQQFDIDCKAKEKARIWSDMERSRTELATRERARAAREQLSEQVQRALTRAADRVECRRRATEEQIRKEKLQVLEKMSAKLGTGDAATDEKEQAILQKAVSEKEAVAEARRRAHNKKQEQMKQERIESRKEFLQQEEQRIQDLSTMRQWELMNRFKNSELDEEMKERLRQDKARKTRECKEDILRLWKERTDRQEAELAAWREFHGPQAERALRAHDERVLAYASELLREARAHQRTEFPLRRAVHRYCRMRYIPTPALLPAEPSGDATAAASELPGDKRDGLLPNVTPNKVAEKNEDRAVIRAGPANGLQKKD